MPIGLIIMRWDVKVFTFIEAKYPENITINEDTLRQIYSTHEYTREPGMISLLVGSLNIASYFTGPEYGKYVILLLDLEEDADIYEGGLADIARIVVQNVESGEYIKIVEQLYQRAVAYPYLNAEQIVAFMYQDEINRLIINRLRDEGVITKSEIKVWLKDIYHSGFFDLDTILNELIKKEIIKETSVKGISSELIFLTKDLFMIRRPPTKLLKNTAEKGLPQEFVESYKAEVTKFFRLYKPSEEDNFKLLELITNPQVYEVLQQLRKEISTKDMLNDLKEKGVMKIDDCLKQLWEHQMIQVFQDKSQTEYYCLISDFHISLEFPKYILNTIIHEHGVKSKSNQVLLEYLNVLETTYYGLKKPSIKQEPED